MKLSLWILFGIITGIVAHFIDRADDRGGVVGTLILAFFGAMMGGLLGNAFLGNRVNITPVDTVVFTIAGSMILLLIQRTRSGHDQHGVKR